MTLLGKEALCRAGPESLKKPIRIDAVKNPARRTSYSDKQHLLPCALMPELRPSVADSMRIARLLSEMNFGVATRFRNSLGSREATGCARSRRTSLAVASVPRTRRRLSGRRLPELRSLIANGQPARAVHSWDSRA